MNGWKALGFNTYQDYLQSSLWIDKAIFFRELKGNKCERCGSTQNLNVHHLSYENVGNEHQKDLILLCKGCHEKEHGHHHR
jgi:5-methylcytosine-specific restriction endonuclease McrA